jgi:hypothetical protein
MTQSQLQELFYYKDGHLYWINDNKYISLKDKRVGSIDNSARSGYIIATVQGKKFKEHRLVWIFHNGAIPSDLQIDHINGTRTDNNIDNLRMVTAKENSWNRTTAKGYTWEKSSKTYRVKLRVNGKDIHIGRYGSKLDAKCAYLEAKEKYHKIEAR